MLNDTKEFVRRFFKSFSDGDLEATKAMMDGSHVYYFPLADAPLDKGKNT